MKVSGKWEMIWKNSDGFEPVRKIRNDLEKILTVYQLYAQKFPDKPKNFRVARFLHLCKYDDRYLTLVILFTPVTLVTLFRSYNQFYWAECITVSGFFRILVKQIKVTKSESLVEEKCPKMQMAFVKRDILCH